MTLAELDEHIKIFKRRVNDPQLSEPQRAAFLAALEGAEKQRTELLAAQAPVPAPSAAKPERAKPKAPLVAKADGQLNIPIVSVEQDPAATPPEPPLQAGGQEKKTVVRSSARTVGFVSTPGNEAAEIVVDCDLEGISKTVIVFRWGSTEERLSPGVAMGRFKARVADVARLKHRRFEESRCFRRAVGYYLGLCRFWGRELGASDFGFRGQRVQILEAIQEIYRSQE